MAPCRACERCGRPASATQRSAVAAEPGVRLPHAVDGFELAVRAVAPQQVSLPSARTTLTRLLAATRSTGGAGTDDPADGLVAFPGPAQVLAAPDAAFRMPAARRETIRALARAVADGELDLEPGGDREEAVRRLAALPGIGPWTTGYLAMRALGDPDVALTTDLGVRRGAAALGLSDDPKTLTAYADRWRPWRSYATIRLWRAA